MEIPTIHVFTHDSIGVGEDGPTHQPIEQLASLRAIPGLITLRPADANEVVEAWRVIMQLQHQPVALVLTRQALPDARPDASTPRRAAWPRAPTSWPTPTGGKPDVHPARHRQRGVALRRGVRAAHGRGHPGAGGEHAVVGAVRAAEPRRTATSVLPPDVTARVSVEQAGTFGWERYVGPTGHQRSA